MVKRAFCIGATAHAHINLLANFEDIASIERAGLANAADAAKWMRVRRDVGLLAYG